MNKNIILSFLLLSCSVVPSFSGGVLSKMAREGSDKSAHSPRIQQEGERKVQQLKQKLSGLQQELSSLQQLQQEFSNLQQLQQEFSNLRRFQQELSSSRKIEPDLSSSRKKNTIKRPQDTVQEVFPHVSSLQSSVLSAASPLLMEYAGLDETDPNTICFPDSVGHKLIEGLHRHAFHEMNAILSRFMDDRRVLKKAVKNHSRVFKFFVLQSMQSTISDRTTVFFPLTYITDPLASCTQGLALIKTNETWMDLFSIMKKTIFGENNLSSFSHEAGVFVRTHIQQSLFALSQGLRYGQDVQALLNLLTPDTLQVNESEDSHSALALDIYKDIGETIYGSLNTLLKALPSDRIEVIEMVSDDKGGEKIISTQSKKASEAELGLLVREYCDKINPLWKAHERVRRTIVELRKRAFIDAFYSSDGESLEMLKASQIVQMALQDQANIGARDGIMDRLRGECDALELCRVGVGLKPRKDHRFFIDMIHASQERYKQDLADQSILLSQIIDGTVVSTDGSKSAEFPEIGEDPQDDLSKNILSVVEDSSGMASSSVQDTEKKIEEDDDMFSHMYTVDYIKEQHAKFQALKKAHAERDSKSASSSSSKNARKNRIKQSITDHHKSDHILKEHEALEAFRLDLYSFLNNEIFHPVYRPTWGSLVENLASFGFKGEVNHNGDGSVWKFTVTSKNKLFWGDNDYQDAFFNVHEYKGSGPINPKYLRYFKTGLSNVFGLSEGHISDVLSYYKGQEEPL